MSSHLDSDQAARAANGAISLRMRSRDSLGEGSCAFSNSRDDFGLVVLLSPLPPLPPPPPPPPPPLPLPLALPPLPIAAAVAAATTPPSAVPLAMDDRNRLFRCCRGEFMVGPRVEAPTDTERCRNTSGRSSSSSSASISLTMFSVAVLFLFSLVFFSRAAAAAAAAVVAVAAAADPFSSRSRASADAISEEEETEEGITGPPLVRLDTKMSSSGKLDEVDVFPVCPFHSECLRGFGPGRSEPPTGDDLVLERTAEEEKEEEEEEVEKKEEEEASASQ